MRPNKLYSNTIIGLELRNLLSQSQIKRMIAAASFDDAVKILIECGWDENNIKHNTNSEDYIINAELTRTVEIFKQLCPDPYLLRLAMTKFDYHNAEVLQKSKLAETNTNDLQNILYSFADAKTAPKNLSEEINRNLKHIKDKTVKQYFESEIKGIPNIELLSKKKDDVFSLSLPLYWFIMKQRELKIVKIILMCKKWDLSREQIRQFLNEVKERK